MKAFVNIVGKGENAGNQHFLLFPQCFLLFPTKISIIGIHLFCRLQMLSIWAGLKFCRMVKSYTQNSLVKDSSNLSKFKPFAYKNLTHYQTTNFRLFQIERVSDNNFKLDENSRKLLKPVENTVGKEEIARYEQFLLFLQCFQKAYFPRTSKSVILWEWVKWNFNH